LKIKSIILFFGIVLSLLSQRSFSQLNPSLIRFDFYGDTIDLPFQPPPFVDYTDSLSNESINIFYQKISGAGYEPLVEVLLTYKQQYKLDDWLYYQLIRKTAQHISPKADNYHRYTLYKWFFLTRSGYDAMLSIAGDQLLFYVQSDENIYNIPYRIRDGKQYVCLNYHDYGSIDFDKVQFAEVSLRISGAHKAFSYKVSQLPNFRAGDYLEKDIRFNYNQMDYYFKVKLNPQIKTLFANYPVVDYESYFNIPLSNETYSSLIPLLKKNVEGMSVKKGVDFLMRFTRYAFLFESDSKQFGKEKRLSPEQTLLYDRSDCEDRSALFFFLVKEIYNLPMIVLVFPQHVTVAVKFDKPVGKPIMYEGEAYSICEPTPQKQDLKIGELIPKLKKSSYEIAYVYSAKKGQ
jgi:hypothetical protein